MADETDTGAQPQETPPGEAAQPEGQAEGQETQAPEGEAQPPAQPEPNPVQQLEERLFQRMASWTGRREKDMLQAIGTLIDQKTQRPAADQPAASSGPTIYDDPDRWLEHKWEDLSARKNQEKMQFFQKAMVAAAGEVLNNPQLAAVKQDLAKEIQAAAPRMRMDLPPDAAGALLAKEAAMNYFLKRNAQPANPLAGNKPAGMPLGTVSGKVTTTAKKSSIPKDLSPQARKYMDYLGWGNKELEEVFGK